MVHRSALQRHNGAVKEDENQPHKNNSALYSRTCQRGDGEHARLRRCREDAASAPTSWLLYGAVVGKKSGIFP